MVNKDNFLKIQERLEKAFEELDRRISSLEITISENKGKVQVHPIGNLFVDTAVMAILKYIKDNQDKFKDEDEGITKQHVAKYMENEQLLSRPSTLKLIEELLKTKNKIIIDAKKRNNARSRLMINPELDINTMIVNALIGSIEDIRKGFEFFDEESKEARGLIDELLDTIVDFARKHKLSEKADSKQIQMLIDRK